MAKKLNSIQQTRQGRSNINLNINPNELPDVECSCGHKVFMQGVLVKYLSAIQSPTGQAGLVNVGVFYCTKCGLAYTPDTMLAEVERVRNSKILPAHNSENN